MTKTKIASPTMVRSNKKKLNTFKKNIFVYLLMLPSIVLTFIFAYLPMPGILVAFQDFNIFAGLWGSPWVGLDNIIRIFEVPLLWGSILNTLNLSLLSIIVGFPAPIILALMINEVKDGLYKRTAQTLSYLPHFLSWIAAVGLAYTFFDRHGPLNNFLVWLYGQDTERILFLSRQELFIPVLLLLNVWKNVGWGAIVYLAAITGIDQSLYEAAYIDGANRFKQHIHITLPGIGQTVIIMLIFTLGGLLASNFELVYGMQNPFIDFEVIDTVVFRSGIQQGDFSIAAAVGFTRGLIAFLLTVMANKMAKKVANISIW